MKKSILAVVGFCAVFFGCMKHPNDAVIADYSKVIAELAIGPPKFARTAQTKDLWLSETIVNLKIDLAAMNGMHKGSSVVPAADTLVGGMLVSLRIDEGRPLDEYMDGMWMMMPPDSLDHHVALTMGNNSGSSDSMRPLAIMYSAVTVFVRDGASLIDSAVLLPIHGPQGLMYGANLAVPLGMTTYSFEAHALAPIVSSHDSSNQGRIQAAMDAQYWAMLHDAPSAAMLMGTTVLADSIKIAMVVNKPETLWIWSTVSNEPVQTVPHPAATVFVGVMLTDLKSMGSGEVLGYSSVQCQIFSDDRHDSTTAMTLNPVHGKNGFYYGVNMPMPATGNHGGGHEM